MKQRVSEIEKEIQEVQRNIFYTEMADHLTREDYEYLDRQYKKLQDLNIKLEQAKNGEAV